MTRKNKSPGPGESGKKRVAPLTQKQKQREKKGLDQLSVLQDARSCRPVGPAPSVVQSVAPDWLQVGAGHEARVSRWK